MTVRTLTSAPTVAIVLALEAAPRVVGSWSTDADEMRISDWINSRPDLVRLLEAAREIAERERAA